jgi:hypothetical protein
MSQVGGGVDQEGNQEGVVLPPWLDCVINDEA